ncbi:MAG TPA: YfiR family protein [Terriglobales bacterium]|nr:YfiR family protein [Terriglobales bacterium]
MSLGETFDTRGTCSKLRLRTAVWILLIAALSSKLPAQLQDEQTVKAAFVFNLTKYVEWPRADHELTIGVIGEGLMGETLKRLLEGRKSEERLIRVVLSPNNEQLESCSVLYFAQSPSKRVQSMIGRVQNKSILTVGDTDSFIGDGGIIGLVRTGDAVQIQVNLEAAQAAHLNISSHLLNLSKIVRKGGPKS